jgi:hypothetical protein
MATLKNQSLCRLEKNVGWKKKSALSKNPKNDDPIASPRRPHRVDYGAARQVLVQVQRWRRDALVADADVRERRLPARLHRRVRLRLDVGVLERL